MLNLNNPIVYTKEEKALLKHVLDTKTTGNDRWGDISIKEIKHKIDVHCLGEQECRCAYCESLLDETNQIEHISPKGTTPDFVFEPLNLVVSCPRCNCTKIKGTKKTIVGVPNPVYQNNSFCIVHPRLDNPNNHFAFIDEEKTIFDKTRCSKKALDTIEFFQWENPAAIQKRLDKATSHELSTPIELYIQSISTYNKS